MQDDTHDKLFYNWPYYWKTFKKKPNCIGLFVLSCIFYVKDKNLARKVKRRSLDRKNT